MDDTQLDDTEFDAIVLGTGLEQSIMAALRAFLRNFLTFYSAISRAGRKVIHLDRNGYYGDGMASLTFGELLDWTKTRDSDNKVGELAVPSASSSACHISVWNCDETIVDELMRDSRRFCIDLTPKMLYSRGAIISILISSGVSRYLEFRAVQNLFVWENGRPQLAPLTQGEVFQNTTLSLIEKRILTKFLKFCAEYAPDNREQLEKIDRKALEALDADSSVSFVDFAAGRGITPHLLRFLTYAVAQFDGNQSESVMQGIYRIQEHIKSLGVYGRSAFLLPLYGSGEVIQAFCRLSAVYGGIYALDRSVGEIVLDGDKFTGVVDTTEQKLTAKWLIVGDDYLPSLWAHDNVVTSSRAICIVRGLAIEVPTNDAPGDALCFLVYPPGSIEGISTSVSVVQVDDSLSACPKNMSILYISCSDKCDLWPVIRSLTNDDAKLLWAVFYDTVATAHENVPDNVLVCTSPGLGPDASLAVKKCEKFYEYMTGSDDGTDVDVDEQDPESRRNAPWGPFLPKMPDPDLLG